MNSEKSKPPSDMEPIITQLNMLMSSMESKNQKLECMLNAIVEYGEACSAAAEDFRRKLRICMGAKP